MIKSKLTWLGVVVAVAVFSVTTLSDAADSPRPSQPMPKLGLAKIGADGELEITSLETAIGPEMIAMPVPASAPAVGPAAPIQLAPHPAARVTTESRQRIGPRDFWVRRNGVVLDAKTAAEALRTEMPVVFAELDRGQDLDGFYHQFFKPETIVVGIARSGSARAALSMPLPAAQPVPGSGGPLFAVPSPAMAVAHDTIPAPAPFLAAPQPLPRPRNGPRITYGPASVSSAARVEIEGIEEHRFLKFMAHMEISLRVAGMGPKEVAGYRYRDLKVVDDTGAEVAAQDDPFGEQGRFKTTGCVLRLKPPARKATALKELSGVVEMLVPGRDPQATVKVAGFVESPRVPVSHASLKAAGAKVTVLTKAEFERVQQAAEKKPDSCAPEKILEQMFGKVFGGLGAMSDPGENSVIALVEDPNQRVVTFEFFDAANREIPASTWNDNDERLVFNFQQRLPKDAVMRITMATPGAIVAVPFKLKDVPLP